MGKRYSSSNMTLKEIIREALREDIGSGDITSNLFVPPDVHARAFIVAKQSGVLSGASVAKQVFKQADSSLEVIVLVEDGRRIKKGEKIISISGRARSILMAERTALNFLSRMSGIATLTAKMVKSLEGRKTFLLDTRKTTPLLRALEKKAVRDGGGKNHRAGLYDKILIKDNHILAAGGIDNILKRIDEIRQKDEKIFIEIEVSNISQFKKAIKHKVDCIMLDNFSPAMVRKAVSLKEKMGQNSVKIELSGGINEQNIVKFASPGVDFISSGALTHSAPALDFSLELRIESTK
jgi:nicotinate-nucleotide pyrophosphorylase (carboxylating)